MINLLRKYHKWRLLDKNEKYCTISVLFWLSTWRLFTQLIPFVYWTKILKKCSLGSLKTYPSDFLLTSIFRCQMFFPHKNACLIQALVFWTLIDTNKSLYFVIGVQKNDTDNFEAHAWIGNQTEILIGKRPFDHFIPIWSFTKI